MSLNNILLEFASNDGISLASPEQKDFLKFRINSAAQELYQENDLVGSLLEQVFDVNVESGMLLSFPTYVGKLRAIRPHKYPTGEGTLRDVRAHYVNVHWNTKDCFDYREITTSPLATDISNTAPLTVRFKQVLKAPVEVTIAGATEYSAHTSEVLKFVAGNTSKTTAQSYVSVSQISKSLITDYDAEVLDIDGGVLSVIPNDKFSVEYTVVQLLEVAGNLQVINSASDTFRYVDVLYKQPFRPFYKDSDEFICGSKYDKAIYWKTKAQIAGARKGEEQNAGGYLSACANIVKQVFDDHDRGKKIEVTGRNFVFRAFDAMGRICR